MDYREQERQAEENLRNTEKTLREMLETMGTDIRSRKEREGRRRASIEHKEIERTFKRNNRRLRQVRAAQLVDDRGWKWVSLRSVLYFLSGGVFSEVVISALGSGLWAWLDNWLKLLN